MGMRQPADTDSPAGSDTYTLHVDATQVTDFVPDPVLSLRRLPKGPTYELDAFRWEDQIKVYIAIGSSPYRDIVIFDRTVSRLHCFLGRIGQQVFVHDQDSKNRTLVNGVAVSGGVVELKSGNLLTLGRTTFLACGLAGEDQEVDITAGNLDSYLHAAARVYPTQERAALALGLWPGTLSKWLRSRRFAKKSRSAAARKRTK